MSVPEKLRNILEPFVEDLKTRELISGVGLFGSWGRGDASRSSDIDLLIVENRDFDYEYFERIELNNYLIDLDYVPKKWIVYRVPPEIDQKIYELQVLFDRDNSLARAKDLMVRIYWKPERVEIRTESYIVEADSYLSRAGSALGRNDPQSVKVNSLRGFWALMKILTEIGKKPILNSCFLRTLEASSKSIEMRDFFDKYVDLMGFANLDKAMVKSMLELLSPMWKETINFINVNAPSLKSLHPKVGGKLNYYGKEAFLKGFVARVSSLVDENSIAESANYMFHTTVDMLENYAYLVSVVEGTRFDYAATLKYLRDSKKAPIEVYNKVIEILGVKDISSQEAEEIFEETRNAAMSIRHKRKDLITRFIG